MPENLPVRSRIWDVTSLSPKPKGVGDGPRGLGFRA